jgi:hypothetical protein
MKLKRKSFFWLGLALLCLVLGARGFYLYNKPHRSVADATVIFAIGADSLFRQYQSDEHAADQKFLNKVVLVSGRLADIQHTGSSEIWILSSQPADSTGPGSPTGGGINCQIFSPGNAASPRPKPGEMVTIKGRCTGFLMDVNLADCVPQ